MTYRIQVIILKKLNAILTALIWWKVSAENCRQVAGNYPARRKDK